MLLKCTRCRLVFLDTSRIGSIPKSKPSTLSTSPSPVWKQLKFDPTVEAWGKAYFDAVLDYCSRRNLVLGDEKTDMIVCAPAQNVLTTTYGNPAATLSRFKVHAIETWDEFLQVIEAATPQFVSPLDDGAYWYHYKHEMKSALKDSGAAEIVTQIDRRFDKKA